MEKVKISVEVEPELRRRVKLAATSRHQTVRQWVLTAIQHELDHGEGEDDIIMPPPGAKPRGSLNPPTPRSGRSVADAIIEDRESSW